MKIISTLIILVLTFSTVSAQTSQEPIKQIAKNYIEAYGDWDFDKMKLFYDEDIFFSDPTASKKFNTDFSAKGKENVYLFFKNIFKEQFKNDKPPYVKLKIEKSFQSNNYVIFNTVFESILPVSWFKKDSNEKILVSMPLVTILEFRNNKILSHTDYGDYSTYQEQIDAQLNTKK